MSQKTGTCCMCSNPGTVPYELGADDKTGKLYCPEHTAGLREFLGQAEFDEKISNQGDIFLEQMVGPELG